MPVSDNNKAQVESLVDQFWGTFDVDGSGNLNQSEAVNLLKAISGDEGNELSDEDFADFIPILDENGDGQITKEDLVSLLMG